MLVGGAITILKNDGVRQWGWDDIPHMKWKIIQPCLKPPTSHRYPMLTHFPHVMLGKFS